MAPHRDAVLAFIGLGANLGEPAQAIAAALGQLANDPDIELLRSSSLYRSAPVQASGPDFINAVALLRTGLSAPALLARLQAIETAAGRQRPWRNAPRTLDLDLLLYGSARIDSPALTVPHPRMRSRAFVLLPLAEIAPDQVNRSDLAAVSEQRIERMPGTGQPH